ncbi:MAG: 50S ribosomal protein L23 [Gammaproteobacteria bacterium]
MSGYSRDRLAGVVLAPHVSEKSARIGMEGNQYVFRVRTDATKPEIRAAVEHLFEVKVDKVRVVNQAGKAKRFGRTPGRRQDWKKAYVRLAAGQQIELGGAERA